MADIVRKFRLIVMVLLGVASLAATGVGAFSDGDRLFAFGLGGAAAVAAFVALEIAAWRAQS